MVAYVVITNRKRAGRSGKASRAVAILAVRASPVSGAIVRTSADRAIVSSISIVARTRTIVTEAVIVAVVGAFQRLASSPDVSYGANASLLFASPASVAIVRTVVNFARDS